MKAKLQMITSMIIFGTIGIVVRNIPLSSGEIALFRAIIAVTSILLYRILTGKRMIMKEIKKDIPILFLSGVAMGANWILFFEAYKYTTVSLATLSYYFAPVLVMIISPILFKEKLSRKQTICFIMASIGLILVIGNTGMTAGKNHVIGVGFGLGAATLYASVIILNKYIKNVTGVDRTIIQFIAAIVVLLPYILLTKDIHISNINLQGYINLFILGILHTGICYCMYFSSLKSLKGQEAAILSYIDPLVAILVSVTILREGISGIQIIGGVLILGFTLLNEA